MPYISYKCRQSFSRQSLDMLQILTSVPKRHYVVLSNYVQPVEDAPLPDGTVCTVRGCFYQQESSVYRFIVPSNCTFGELEAFKVFILPVEPI